MLVWQWPMKRRRWRLFQTATSPKTNGWTLKMERLNEDLFQLWKPSSSCFMWGIECVSYHAGRHFVDGRNPALVKILFETLAKKWYCPYPLVQELFHQQHSSIMVSRTNNPYCTKGKGDCMITCIKTTNLVRSRSPGASNLKTRKDRSYWVGNYCRSLQVPNQWHQLVEVCYWKFHFIDLLLLILHHLTFQDVMFHVAVRRNVSGHQTLPWFETNIGNKVHFVGWHCRRRPQWRWCAGASGYMSSRQNYWMNRVGRSCLELWSSSWNLHNR